MSVIRGRRFRNLEQFHGIESMTIDNRDIQCTIAAKRAFFVYQDRERPDLHCRLPAPNRVCEVQDS